MIKTKYNIINISLLFIPKRNIIIKIIEIQNSIFDDRINID